MYATDRRQTKASLNAPTYYGRGIIMVIRSIRFFNSVTFCCIVRLIFWTEWLRSHTQTARIGRALGDGSNVTYIRTTQLGWPNGLAVDIRFRRIWWCDAMFDR